MLADVRGKANSIDVLAALPGETIKGAFGDGQYLTFVMESGDALVLTSLGGREEPAFWAEMPHNWQERRSRSREALISLQRQIDHLDTFMENDDR